MVMPWRPARLCWSYRSYIAVLRSLTLLPDGGPLITPRSHGEADGQPKRQRFPEGSEAEAKGRIA